MKSAILGILLFGCTDAQMSSIDALGSPAKVQCFSGGQVVYEGKTTGRVAATSQSDGWEFREAGSHDFVRVSGTCIIRNTMR